MDRVVVRFAGDSGDGMQLIGDRFTADAATFGNDVSTLPNFPAEIRAPAGTLAGVSSFQIHLADYDILTPGDAPDVLVAMNPAALRANLEDLRPGGDLIVDTAEFKPRPLAKVGYESNPLDDGTLSGFTVHSLDMTKLATASVEHLGLGRKDAARVKNMFALGLVSWLFQRPLDGTISFIESRFGRKDPTIAAANVAALKAGWNYGDTTEAFRSGYIVQPATLPPGRYRNISGGLALSYGLMAASARSGLQLFVGAYPITPASNLLHELSKHKHAGVVTFQAEDEIAAAGAALGAAFGGKLAVTTTSGPGFSLKQEVIGLAVSLELPLVIVDVQRGGPSTGLPTKTEQADLLMAMFARNGEAPIPIVAPQSPGDCFDAAFEAARIAVASRTPVVLLADGYLANGAEPWKIPDLDDLPVIEPAFATETNHVTEDGEEVFWPYLRDDLTLARPWVVPGTPGLEHRIGGIEKSDGPGHISYAPANHQQMVSLRQQKVDRVADRLPQVQVEDPGARDGSGASVLVLGWGSTYGPIGAACRRVRRTGRRVAHAQLRYLNPFPQNLGALLRSYDKVIVPEMNLGYGYGGQLAMLLRAKYLVDVEGLQQVRGMPFRPAELAELLTRSIDGTHTDDEMAGSTWHQS
ncbi:2-oxoacid:acceptor oxidoreductase subunit alpha [Georgenia ruanii]|uniref:2-oxoacid:acceptor oxidoreductase subunit alpha n=2 Tax=Georgenia ruanii TaxID=348442 RepID=A0A7J9UXB3_9MICO|nr:2-oxoacid:acceptor oxidoreductase subunit alpha [Georgenia ruanii]